MFAEHDAFQLQGDWEAMYELFLKELIHWCGRDNGKLPGVNYVLWFYFSFPLLIPVL